MSSQRFCLRWNNHQSNLLSVFDQLLHDESFVDVTLAVEGRFLRAHKMVLSACSPYFQALFVGHPDKHPIVILKDVPFSDMRSLLDFMYRGEVSVDQDRLTAFLKVAESLRIKGLTEVNEERCDLPSITSSLLSSSPMSHSTPPPHLHRIHPVNLQRRVAMPLLGSALTAPKRKRGRPRKLSGSSNVGSDGKEGEDRLGDGVPSSEEICEQNMVEAGGQRAVDGEGNAIEKINAMVNEHGSIKENHNAKRMKADDQEPTPGTSADPSTFAQPGTRADGQTLEPYSIDPGYRDDPPSITFELCTDPDSSDQTQLTTGIHFLTHDPEEDCLLVTKSEEIDPEEMLLDVAARGRQELLEYLIREDGSVVCKWCGEVLPSRTHWYRHKYKFHVPNSTTNGPAPLFKCDRCNVFFKSRKGYIGHLATRHGDLEKEEGLVDIEVKADEAKGRRKHNVVGIREGDYEEQREKEEKLVADIIDRVRRECEATGTTVTRRGYSRRSTVMNS